MTNQCNSHVAQMYFDKVLQRWWPGCDVLCRDVLKLLDLHLCSLTSSYPKSFLDESVKRVGVNSHDIKHNYGTLCTQLFVFS